MENAYEERDTHWKGLLRVNFKILHKTKKKNKH